MDARKVGIGDGGHTFAVVSDTVDRFDALKAIDGWAEPYVWVRFMTSKATYVSPEEMVEALNTSTQVKEHTMDEYRNEFQPLKDILTSAGFDINTISCRENDAGTWDVRDIVQRLGCFLKDTRDEFLALADVMVGVMFLPEYIHIAVQAPHLRPQLSRRLAFKSTVNARREWAGR